MMHLIQTFVNANIAKKGRFQPLLFNLESDRCSGARVAKLWIKLFIQKMFYVFFAWQAEGHYEARTR